MKNISETIVFVNIENNGKREVREARFVELFAKFENIHWRDYKDMVNPKIYGVRRNTNFKLEIAGIGVVTDFELKNMKGVVCTNEIDACNQKNAIFTYSYGGDSLDLDWTDIRLEDLTINNDKFSLIRNPNYGFIELMTKSWFYDGTKAVSVILHKKFQYDFIHNRVVEFDHLDSTYNDYKLYASKEMCEADNEPKIVRFGNKPQQVKKVVTFEIKAVVEVEENENYDVIVETAVNKIKNAPNKTLCETYTSIQ